MIAQRRRFTPKQRVLARYPNAHCYAWAGPYYCIYPGDKKFVRGKPRWWLLNNPLNEQAKTPQQAWAAAARSL